MRLTHFSLAIAASLAVATPALATDLGRADDLRAQVTLGLDFGSAAPARAGYALTLGYRSEANSPVANLLRLDVTDAGAIARLAGVPLFTNSFQANAVDGDNWRQDEKPWYAHSWVYWTLGGLAASAALASAGSSGGHDGDRPTPNPDGGPKVCAVEGGTVADQPLPSACSP